MQDSQLGFDKKPVSALYDAGITLFYSLRHFALIKNCIIMLALISPITYRDLTETL